MFRSSLSRTPLIKLGLLLCLTCLNGAAPALAQNLLFNPGFNSNTANWSTSGTGSMIWSNVDANASASSGSAMLVNDSAGPSQGLTLSQCLPMPARAAYFFSGKAMVPSGGSQTLSNSVRISLRLHTELDCSDSTSGPSNIGAAVSLFDTWQPSGPTLRVAPPGNRAVQVRGLLSKVAAGGTALAHFDDFAAVPDTLMIGSFE